MKDQTIHLYKKKFGALPDIVVKSPGRINLIGEHTDYNMGFVMPAAINKAVFVAVGKREDREIHLFSEEYSNSTVVNIDTLKPSKGWTSYVLGVAHQFLKSGKIIDGFNIVLNSELPIGSGLASSAAIECAVAFALNKMFEINFEDIQLALLSQKAENDFAKVNCGIMDQFTSLLSKKDHVIKLDCRSLEYNYYPFPLKDVQIVLLDSQVELSNASSEYNIRRKECEKGVKYIHKKYRSVKSLRDATIDQIDDCLNQHDVLYKRCKFVVEENDRVNRACDYFINNDYVSFGKTMNESHEGLSKLYEVSCTEVDFLVEKAQQFEGVLGARIMGGGFGGCSINLVKNEFVEGLINYCTKEYKNELGLDLKVYKVETDNGTQVLEL